MKKMCAYLLILCGGCTMTGSLSYPPPDPMPELQMAHLERRMHDSERRITELEARVNDLYAQMGPTAMQINRLIQEAEQQQP